MLLEIVRDFKAKKGYVGVEWESIKDKYENICETCLSNLPKQTVKFVHIQQIYSLEKRLHLEANKYEQNNKKLWIQDGKVDEVE